MKKIISMLLVVCMMLSFSAGAYAASWTPTVENTTVEAGEDVVVKINLDEDMEKITTVAYRLYYNPDLFVLKSHSNGDSGVEMVLSSESITEENGTYYNLSFIDTTSTGKTIKAGLIYTLVFTALESVTESEEASFNLEYYKGMDANWNSITHSGGNLTVTVDPKPVVTLPDKGFYVSIGEDASIKANESAELFITVGSKEHTAYNAYYFEVQYDSKVLTYKGTEVPAIAEDGTAVVKLAGYGADKSFDTDKLSLKFDGTGIGSSDVVIKTAKVDIEEKADSQNAPDAVIVEESVNINVGGYTVTLPDDFEGDGAVAVGEDYIFEAKDKNYNYVLKASIGEDDIPYTDNKDGSFTISANSITGNITVVVEQKIAKSYQVIDEGDDDNELSYTGVPTYMSDFVFTVAQDEGYNYDIVVKINDKEVTYTSNEENEYTVDGKDITGDVKIIITKTKIEANESTIKFTGTAAADVVNGTEQAAENGKDFIFSLNKVDGFIYTVSLNGEELVPDAEGKYTISGDKIVGETLIVTVEKQAEKEISVSVSQYVKLDNEAAWLVKVTDVPEGVSLGYKEGDTAKNMFWSEKYQAYTYLVISAKSEAEVLAEAEAAVVEVAEHTNEVAYDMDINKSGSVDVNDAQLVYNMYNVKYDSFDVVSVGKFLSADVNGDGEISVLDANAIISEIVK
ncbi:MAG: hypothetical protein IJ364_05755 [Oscillospiraceae bacterium]|nr:hypothetical protein [Oscillospiraceae bacterium]